MTDNHRLPATSIDDRTHNLDRDCWCDPTVVRGWDGNDLVIHSDERLLRLLDLPPAQIPPPARIIPQ